MASKGMGAETTEAGKKIPRIRKGMAGTLVCAEFRSAFVEFRMFALPSI